MVRKKLKKAIQLQQTVAEVIKSHQQFQHDNHGGDSPHHDRDLLDVVNCWLQYLCLSLPETTSPQLDVFGALRNAEVNPFARVRGLQSLRARVQDMTKVNRQPLGTGDDPSAQARESLRQELHLVFVVGLLLYMDPDTGSLRKTTKGLLLTAEKAAEAIGSNTDSITEKVFIRFLDRSREFTSMASPSNATRTGTTAYSTPSSTTAAWPAACTHGASIESEQASLKSTPHSAAASAHASEFAVRTVASLQWLIDTPSGQRSLLGNTDPAPVVRTLQDATGNADKTRPPLFGRSIALLDLLLQAQPLDSVGAGQGKIPLGRDGDVQVNEADADSQCGGACAGVRDEVISVEGGERTGAAGAAKFPGTIKTLECCSEILKAAACLMSLNKSWEVRQISGGDSIAMRMCTVCLRVLSSPEANREAITHASNVLLRSVIASWRSGGLWPRERMMYADTDHPQVIAEHLFDANIEGPSTAGTSGQRNARCFETAAATLTEVFLSAGNEAGERPRQQRKRLQARAEGDGMSALISPYMPLPDSSSLAMCRAIMHDVSPDVLLAPSADSANNPGVDIPSDGGRGKCLLVGPVLNSILRWCRASSGLQLRFYASQVLEAWFGRAKTLVESGFSLEATHILGRSDEMFTGNIRQSDASGSKTGLDRALSEVMDVTLDALVHPSKLISSMGPILLEHVVNLRQLVRKSSGNPGLEGDSDEYGRVMERVLGQSASANGRYIALSVLLPRVGARRLLNKCPSLVEQLVWAVGARGNVSRHATSLLLQLLTAMAKERVAPKPNAEEARERKATAKGAASDGGERSRRSTAWMCRKWWVVSAADALTQEDLWSRDRVAAYLLPEVLKLDPLSVADLFTELRKRRAFLQSRAGYCDFGFMLGVAEGVGPDVRCMWAMLEVARHARRAGAWNGISVIAHRDDRQADKHSRDVALLVLSEVRWAALHADETLRMSAISLLCSDLRITTVPPPAETDLLQEVLPCSLKIYGAQSRQLLLRALQILLSRMRETVRVCAKASAGKGERREGEGAKRQAPKGKGKDNQARPGAVDERRVTIGVKGRQEDVHLGKDEAPGDVVARMEGLTLWLCQAVLESLYPGCPFEREVLGLEILQLVLSELLPSENKGRRHDHEHGALAKVASSSLFCRRWVDTLLSLLGSSWDRTRSLSYSILARFPRPLAGYDGCDGATRLSKEGLRLAGSGRQRESERGALILRLVFVSHVHGLGLDVPLLSLETRGRWTKEAGSDGMAERGGVAGWGCRGMEGVGDDMELSLRAGSPTVRFLEHLYVVLVHRLDSMQKSFEMLLGRSSTPPATADGTTASSRLDDAAFPHGILLAIHYIILDSGRLIPQNQGVSHNKEFGKHVMPSYVDVDVSRTVDPHTDTNVSRRGRSRRQVMGLLLQQALRALRLSLLIVGENDGTAGGDLPSFPSSDSDIVGDNNDIVSAHSSAVACDENDQLAVSPVDLGRGHEGYVSMPTGEDAKPPPKHNTVMPMGAMSSATPIIAVATAGRSSRSVNANGHVGGISVEKQRTHGVGEQARKRARPTTASEDRMHTPEDAEDSTDDLGEGTAEGQRAVVGAWLLAKESCRCLATMITTSRLLRSQEVTRTAAASLNAAVPGAEFVSSRQGSVAPRRRSSEDPSDLGSVRDFCPTFTTRTVTPGEGVTSTADVGRDGECAPPDVRRETAIALGDRVGGNAVSADGAASGAADAADVSKGGRERGEVEEDSNDWVLPADVMDVGETLLESLLALRHMGCVAAAQTAFQTVCESLLREGEGNLSLSQLPSSWLDKLVDQLTGAKQEFVLRRSAGLATAFIAILRAEPRSVAPTLLPRGMRDLLALAMPTDQLLKDDVSGGIRDWKGRVHALNVLRLVFLDSTLADDIGPYVTEATMAAVYGFEDPEWAVRNSSMMLFASIMQRVVGGAKNATALSLEADESKKRPSARGAVTAQAFFQQYSSLHPFLLAQLERAASHANTSATGALGREPNARAGGGRGVRAEMHPVLYPILLLLARLRSGHGDVTEAIKMEDGEAKEGLSSVLSSANPTSAVYAKTATSAFVSLVIRCGGDPHFLARAVGARALAALVPPPKSPGLMLDLLRGLPKDPTGMISMGAGAGAHNQVHGTLLQLLELILAACATSQSTSVHHSTDDCQLQSNTTPITNQQELTNKAPPRVVCSYPSRDGHASAVAIVEGIVMAVFERRWLANPSLCRCPSIRYAMLRFLEGFACWLEKQSTTGVGSDSKESAVGYGDFRTNFAAYLTSAREANFRNAVEEGETGRHVPGQSLLTSYAVTAVVRDRLEFVFLGKTRQHAPPAVDGVGRARDDGEEAATSKDNVISNCNRAVFASLMIETEFVAGLLSHADTDVREAAIKATKKWFGSRLRHGGLPSGPAAGIDVENAAGQSRWRSLEAACLSRLWVAGAKAVGSETHPPNMRRLLRLLSRVGAWIGGQSLSAGVAKAATHLWEYLCMLCDDGTGVGGTGAAGNVHAAALEAIGGLIRLAGKGVTHDTGEMDTEANSNANRGNVDENISSEFEEADSSVHVDIGVYARLLEFAAEPEQPVSTRVAAAQSLASSGLLMVQSDWSNAEGNGPEKQFDCPTSAERKQIRLADRSTKIAGKHFSDHESGDDPCGATNAVLDDATRERDRGRCEAFVRVCFVLLSLLQDVDEGVRLCASRASAAAGIAGMATTTPTTALRQGDEHIAPVSQQNDGLRTLREVQVVLHRLASLAEDDASNSIAEHTALAIFRAVYTIASTIPEELLDMIGSRRVVEGERDGDMQEFADMGENDGVLGDGGRGRRGAGVEIFGREVCIPFEEPALFACVAARCLSRVLTVLAEPHNRVGSIPQAVVEGISDALNNVAGVIEGVAGAVGSVPGVTWIPEVYEGVTASFAVGTAILAFLSARNDGGVMDTANADSEASHGVVARDGVKVVSVTKIGSATSRSVDVGIGGGAQESTSADFARETARVVKACLLFEAARRRDEGAAVHPCVAEGITRVLHLAQQLWLP